VRETYKKILKKEKIKLIDFKNPHYRELSYPGREKKTFYSVNDFEHKIYSNKIILKFTLPMGVYANLFLDNLIENKKEKSKLE